MQHHLCVRRSTRDAVIHDNETGLVPCLKAPKVTEPSEEDPQSRR